jgi:DNA-binding MurR/RpiR family transcriptional regulator
MSQGFASYPEATFEELVQKMTAAMPNLPKQEAHVAQYILLNLDTLSIETGKSLAQKVGVSEVTVGRLLRRLGCDGMRELKALLRRRYSVAGGVLAQRCTVPQRWHKSLEAELGAVQSAFAQMGGENFHKAGDILISSSEVFVTGFQSVRGLAEDHARRLSIARSGVRYLSSHDGMLAEWIGGYEAEKTCLVLIDVVPYARESQVLATLARDQGRKVIVVSDEYCHWSRDIADAVFYAPSATGLFLESILGLNAILSLLVDVVAQATDGLNGDRLGQWKRLSKAGHLF